jgi:CRISPR-associated endonuclease Cas2
MSVKLITYDISDNENRRKCREAIEEYEYINIGGSDYLVSSTKNCTEHVNELKKFIDTATDELFVSKVYTKRWAAYGLGRTKEKWIEDNATTPT